MTTDQQRICALSNSLRSLIAALETVDADERERARNEDRGAHIHSNAIREAQATLSENGDHNEYSL